MPDEGYSIIGGFPGTADLHRQATIGVFEDRFHLRFIPRGEVSQQEGIGHTDSKYTPTTEMGMHALESGFSFGSIQRAVGVAWQQDQGKLLSEVKASQVAFEDPGAVLEIGFYVGLQVCQHSRVIV
jgi:hypothetical protein